MGREGEGERWKRCVAAGSGSSQFLKLFYFGNGNGNGRKYCNNVICEVFSELQVAVCNVQKSPAK